MREACGKTWHRRQQAAGWAGAARGRAHARLPPARAQRCTSALARQPWHDHTAPLLTDALLASRNHAGSRKHTSPHRPRTLDVAQVLLGEILVKRVLAQHHHALVCTAQRAQRGQHGEVSKQAWSAVSRRASEAGPAAARDASSLLQYPRPRPGRTVQPLDDLITDRGLACAGRGG